MRSREEYVRFVKERTGFSLSADDSTLVFMACFELFAKDFSEMARNTLGSWIPLLDARRKAFNDALNLRAERVLHEAVQQAKNSADVIAGNLAGKIREQVEKAIAVESTALQKQLNRTEKMVYICAGSAIISCMAACAGVFL